MLFFLTVATSFGNKANGVRGKTHIEGNIGNCLLYYFFLRYIHMHASIYIYFSFLDFLQFTVPNLN